MQRGLTGSEQGIVTKWNSAGTCQPLMLREGVGAKQNQLGSGNQASTIGIKKILWKGM